ncbi:GNAT family N-acetyltransferase [Aurantiacibacter sp. MUD11]|uniref:GNAT family N-acetyltransferase n=1 Tax=Aurantiacibacter sp. MUD11 TaxID=3003265 RepID=UPI0022AB29BB|nr:GNAT family N-acetyltransferase [Aurantiacibacter sp. MUD11]WAT17215.1 GNAT family N-acetyltransferase [Aurantiacibacter sp. MUD11]
MAEFRYETDRLILRDWREEDWPNFWRLTNTPTVMRWLGGVADADARTDQRGRIETYQRLHGHTFWVVEHKADGSALGGEMLGCCGLKRANAEGSPVFGMMEAGWRLREDAWGKGFAKEAAGAALDIAFGQFAADETIALTMSPNRASWGLMLALGMQRREELDYHDPYWGPELNPTIVHSIGRQDWLDRRNG